MDEICTKIASNTLRQSCLEVSEVYLNIHSFILVYLAIKLISHTNSIKYPRLSMGSGGVILPLITQSLTKWCLYHLDARAVMSPRMLSVKVMYSAHSCCTWNFRCESAVKGPATPHPKLVLLQVRSHHWIWCSTLQEPVFHPSIPFCCEPLIRPRGYLSQCIVAYVSFLISVIPHGLLFTYASYIYIYIKSWGRLWAI